MSGGYFDYESLRVGSFADMLKQELTKLNHQEYEQLYEVPSKYVLDFLSRFQQDLEKMGTMCMNIEWTLSGDHSWATLEGLIKDYEGSTLGPQEFINQEFAEQRTFPPQKIS